MCRRLASAALGERVGLPTVCFLGEDESFVREQLECRVDRSRAGLPRAVAALLDLTNDLVSVHRSFREERQDARANVTASHPWCDSSLELGMQILNRFPQAEACLVCAVHC